MNVNVIEKDSVLHALMQAYQLAINTEALLKREVPKMDSETRAIVSDCITSLNDIQNRLLESPALDSLAPPESSENCCVGSENA